LLQQFELFFPDFPDLHSASDEQINQDIRDDPFRLSLAILPYTHPKQKKEI
jgi:hypothetical protein